MRPLSRELIDIWSKGVPWRAAILVQNIVFEKSDNTFLQSV